MRYGDQGREVRDLQRALIAKGCELPVYGADGDFGQETRVALERFATTKGIAWSADDEVPEALIAALESTPEVVEVIGPSSADLDLEGVELYDLRSEQSDPHPKSKRDRQGKTVRREPASIDSIVLHQTGSGFAGEGEQLARRSLRVACHAMAFRAGFVAWPADPTWYVYHADRLNSCSLGLEVDGNYPGLLGGHVSHGDETKLTDELVFAARMGIKLLVEEGRRAGCPIKYIYAHRQSDSWRRADPGEGLWRRVVLEYAVPTLQLVAEQSRSFTHPKGSSRHGKPVPSSWDPAGVGRY